MFSSSTLTFSMGSGERKRCSNMAPVRRLRSFAWINARRLPGVLCSTLKTVCNSLLCLMTIPGRICVAGIAIEKELLHFSLDWVKQKPQHSIVALSLFAKDPGKEVADAVHQSLFGRC